ncbi:MAG: dienelactone hydrolase family protein [Pseudomonadota bacterium]
MAGTDEAPIIYPPIVVPDSVERSKITYWARGLAIDADLYRPKSLSEDVLVPAVVMSHGMGGDKETPGRYAVRLAEAGMIVLSFTHASWGNSQGRLVSMGTIPESDENGEASVKVKVIRDSIDPLEWVDTYRAAIDYLEGEPNVDTSRIGAWGTSFGGGTAFYAAAEDDRIKAVAIQVPAVFNAPPPMAAHGKARAIQIARGEFDPIPQSQDELPGLKGTPHFARLAQFKVGDQAERINVPTLILDAANEELFDTNESGAAANRILTKRGIECYYEVIPDIDHYGIYFDGFERSCQLAHDWFTKHL